MSLPGLAARSPPAPCKRCAAHSSSRWLCSADAMGTSGWLVGVRVHGPVVDSPSGRIRALVDPSGQTWHVLLDGVERASMPWTTRTSIAIAPDDASIAYVHPAGARSATVLVRGIASGSDEVAGV